ncbi:MAG: hypothetical protein ACRENG_14655 [bacterium]
MANTSANIPDEVLVVAAILGDLEAFNGLALRYRAAVVRLAQTTIQSRARAIERARTPRVHPV